MVHGAPLCIWSLAKDVQQINASDFNTFHTYNPRICTDSQNTDVALCMCVSKQLYWNVPSTVLSASLVNKDNMYRTLGERVCSTFTLLLFQWPTQGCLLCAWTHSNVSTPWLLAFKHRQQVDHSFIVHRLTSGCIALSTHADHDLFVLPCRSYNLLYMYMFLPVQMLMSNHSPQIYSTDNRLIIALLSIGWLLCA